jgi:ABC-type sugar transport system ATPase subunit
MSKIIFENVTKKFRENIAINNLSFTCNESEFFVILGPSGAGKTTIMNLIAGLEEVSKGSIYFNDKIINNVEPRYRNIAYAFENYSLYPNLNVYENISFPLKSPIRKEQFSKEQIDAKIDEITTKLQIEELLSRNINQLSGGQKQRVVLARTLVREPEVYLLDEAIAHLDSKLRHEARAMLKKIQVEKKTTTIFATPDYFEALAMADRVAIINYGTLQQLDTSEDIYRYPANVFVAKYFSEPPMNTFFGKLFSKDSEMLINVNGISFIIPNKIKEILSEKSIESQVIVGIRSDDMSIAKEGNANSNKSNIITGEINGIEYFGDTFLYSIKIADFLTKISLEKPIDKEINEKISLQFDMDKIFIFDKGTEKRIWPQRAK